MERTNKQTSINCELFDLSELYDNVACDLVDANTYAQIHDVYEELANLRRKAEIAERDVLNLLQDYEH